MNYNYIESLVVKAKDNKKDAINELIKEFTPYIINISKKTFIPSYTYEDILSECYTSLLVAIKRYNINRHRFVAYALTAIKNNLWLLAKRNKKINLDYVDFINEIAADDIKIDDNLLNNEEADYLTSIISKLSSEEYTLYKYLFIDNKSIKEYAYINNLQYHTVYWMRKNLLYKIKKLINKYLITQ